MERLVSGTAHLPCAHLSLQFGEASPHSTLAKVFKGTTASRIYMLPLLQETLLDVQLPLKNWNYACEIS